MERLFLSFLNQYCFSASMCLAPEHRTVLNKDSLIKSSDNAETVQKALERTFALFWSVEDSEL